jgi:hypothetical protein
MMTGVSGFPVTAAPFYPDPEYPHPSAHLIRESGTAILPELVFGGEMIIK